jgi:hypothetical protein
MEAFLSSMSVKRRALLFSLGILPLSLLFAADLAWKDKQVPEWSEDDAKQVLAESGWVKSVTPSLTRNTQSSPGPGTGRGNVGFGMPGLGFPGGGGMGRRGGGYPNNRTNTNTNNDPDQRIPMLTLRWESAMPVREAELKARDVNAPTLEDQDHYAIAVYGVPVTMVNGDSKKLADDCKKNAALKREDKKDIKPTSVQVLRREDGPVIVFLFPRTKEITKDDRRVEFDAQINKLALTQSFYLEDMTFQGKVEL